MRGVKLADFEFAQPVVLKTVERLADRLHVHREYEYDIVKILNPVVVMLARYGNSPCREPDLIERLIVHSQSGV
jgi:hypothetical protein